MKTKVVIALFGLFAFNTHVKGQNDSVTNFFEIKARWEEKLSTLSGVENEEGETDEEMEDGELANFNRWVAMWRYRLGPNGEMTTANEVMNQIQSSGLLSSITRNSMSCDPPEDDNVFWTNLGPFNSQGGLGSGNGANFCGGYLVNKQQQGRIESISVNPIDQDDIVIGAYNGGIWRKPNSIDPWINTTDDEGYSIYGASSLIRHPANSDIIYASTSGKGGNFGGILFPYGMGVIMSANGGTTWQKTGLTYPNFGTWNSTIVKLVIDPNSTLVNTILYAFSSSDVWKWQGDQFANGAWTSIWQDPVLYKGALWYDYVNEKGDMVCASNGDIWFSNYYGLYKIPNGSSTATLVTNYTIPADFVNPQPGCGNSNQNLRQDISIEINQQGHIVFFCKFTKCSGSPTTRKYFYKSVDNGNSWTRIVTTVNGFLPQQFVVNPQNSDMIYAENSSRCMYKYTFDYVNGTESSSEMGNSENHVDVRTLLAYGGSQVDGSDNILFVGTDGGISKTINGNIWLDISGQGLSITNYYGVGITETNDKMILAGAQDGSINYYNNGSFFETLPGQDNGDCLISSPGNVIVLQESSNGQATNGIQVQGNLIGSIFTPTTSFNVNDGFVNPLCWNPSVGNEFFVGITKCYLGTLSNPSLTPIYDQNSPSYSHIHIFRRSFKKKS